MKFKCKTDMWYSWEEGEIFEANVEWKVCEYLGTVIEVPYFFKNMSQLKGTSRMVQFYLFPDQFEPVG